MASSNLIESTLTRGLGLLQGRDTPPGLAAALHYAVFPGGARVRPWLVLAVAEACGNRFADASRAAASAIEFLHCASLAHDDLPCFDDAATRRGRPSLHAAFGEQLAVLTGDALIVGAFDVLTDGCRDAPDALASLVRELSAGVGAARGIVAGQAWESEPSADLRAYHKLKTGALFIAATRAGAIAGGGDPTAWTRLGKRLGEAYQVADDIADAIGHAEELGKPTGQDASFDRPSAVRELGLTGAYARLTALCRSLEATVPECEGRDVVAAEIPRLCARLFPAHRSDPSGSYPPVTGSDQVSAA